MSPETASETDVLGRVVQWAEGHPLVRAVILESSRAVGQAAIDRFSDYDILLVVSDVRPFADDDAWQRYFAEPLVRFGDAFDVLGFKVYMRLVLYQDHTKIDYAIWPVELLRHVVEHQESTDLLDWGYRVLLDKDGLAARLPAPPAPRSSRRSRPRRNIWRSSRSSGGKRPTPPSASGATN